jgi:hypothetical protein
MSVVRDGLPMDSLGMLCRADAQRLSNDGVSEVRLRQAICTGNFEMAREDRSRVVEVMALANNLMFTLLSSLPLRSHFFPS